MTNENQRYRPLIPIIECTERMEDSGESRQIFQIENTQRLHISVNLQHIWGLSSSNNTNHTKHSIRAPFHVLKSISNVEQ